MPISNKISNLLKSGNAIIPYFTFGDPNPEFTEELVIKAFENGADCIEIGLPFSDPIADGPIIQASHKRALENQKKPTIKAAFEMVKRIKQNEEKYAQKPIVFMGSVNLFLNYGLDKFFKDAKNYLCDGVIIPDLSIEDADPYIKAAKTQGIPIIFLISPLCSEHRLKKITQASNGFVYLLSSKGVTGLRTTISNDLSKIAKKIKKVKDIPIAVGFGISSKEHVKKVHKFAEGAIIGSYFVNIIEDNVKSPQKAIRIICEKIKSFSNQ